MLFKRRMGFSGTPSELLPLELGKCRYHAGTDGNFQHVLTSPNVVSLKIIEMNWSVTGLLDTIAKSSDPVYHALIDTGALITGMNNLEVATYLITQGLAWAEGVSTLPGLPNQQPLALLHLEAKLGHRRAAARLHDRLRLERHDRGLKAQHGRRRKGEHGDDGRPHLSASEERSCHESDGGEIVGATSEICGGTHND